MPRYAYVATDHDGASSQGTVEAQSPQAAHQMLRDRGLVFPFVPLTHIAMSGF